MRLASSCAVLCILGSACTSDGGGSGKGNLGAEAAKDAAPEAAPPPPDPDWSPEVTLASLPGKRRELLDLRGLIHEHSPHSHDACDNEPRVEGGVNLPCMNDFRRGMCDARHDFIFLTDHPDLFASVEYPETLLYDAALGDQLVQRDGSPVANRAGCPDGPGTLLLAGSETDQVMPVGLERHAADRSVYSSRAPADVATMRALGAVVLAAHTEGLTADGIIESGIDGFEMFNLHAQLELNLQSAGPLLLAINDPARMMHPDLVMLAVFSEDPAYLTTWGTVLSRGHRSVTTMGTDAHRNSLPIALSDGDRIDSWRRMNRWFSNHLLVEPAGNGSWDDRAVKEALRARRLYGVFEILGYPLGFDFHARAGSAVTELGGTVTLGAELRVAIPSVRGLTADVPPPELTARLLRAVEGGWEEVATSREDLTFEPTTPGAYRAEIRVVPRHLSRWLGDFQKHASADLPWIYSNAIWVE